MATKLINDVYHTSYKEGTSSPTSIVAPIQVSNTFWDAQNVTELSASGLTAAEVRRASLGNANCVVNEDGNVHAIVSTQYLGDNFYGITIFDGTYVQQFSVTNGILSITRKTVAFQNG